MRGQAERERTTAETLAHTEVASAVEQFALKPLIPIVVCVYVISLLAFSLISKGTPIEGKELAVGVTIAAVLFTLAAIIAAFHQRQSHIAQQAGRSLKLFDWILPAVVIAVGYAIVIGVISYAVMSAVAAAFKGLSYRPMIAAVWPALAAVVVWYGGVTKGAFAKMTDVMRLVGLYLIAGVLIAGIANPNPSWWKISISYLGMNGLKSANVFNLSMMIAAALFLASAVFTFPSLRLAHTKGLISSRSLNFMRFFLIWAPCGLFLVGAFPYGASPLSTFLHNFGAYTMFLFMGVAMLLIGKLMPFLSRAFMHVNYALFAALVAMGLFCLIPPHHLTLALFEALGIALVAVWLVLTLTALEDELER